MAAIKDTLLDKDKNEIYPKTVTDNVFDSEGNRLDNLIGSIKGDLVELAKYEVGGRIDLSSYTQTPYVCPSDGYVFVHNDSSHNGYVAIGTNTNVSSGGGAGRFSVYVKKGVKLYAVGSANIMAFCPIQY